MPVAPMDFEYSVAFEEILVRASFVRLDAAAFLSGNANTPYWMHGTAPEAEADADRARSTMAAQTSLRKRWSVRRPSS
jgi:hypothetical protein